MWIKKKIKTKNTKMQTHGRELLLLILDSATRTKVSVLEPQAAGGNRAGAFRFFFFFFGGGGNSGGVPFLFICNLLFVCFFSFLPRLVKKRTLLKP